jgi:hypothetical protein
MTELKSPTCRDCAHQRGLRVPGDIHTVYEGECANCGETRTVSSASDWRRPGERVYLAEWD